MDAEHRRFLEERYDVRAWHGRSAHPGRVIKGFTLAGSEISGFTALRTQRDDRAEPPAIRSLWRRGEAESELLAIDLFECTSVEAAHDQVLEVLGNIESNAIELRTSQDAPGDVTFGLGDTLVLFALTNLVILIRNAGPTVLPVGDAARDLDTVIERRLESEKER